ncbi:hypothetical protein E2C01_083405 [Portunus trituberculatus]|uniref:Uncharacterized protein n=1 Tax=Portunus trituberculatus TaxID=210409 RepID=A0A5B7J1N5_PORTR|nr:hypothetical protein [Portunus trituberculatus]
MFCYSFRVLPWLQTRSCRAGASESCEIVPLGSIRVDSFGAAREQQVSHPLTWGRVYEAEIGHTSAACRHTAHPTTTVTVTITTTIFITTSAWTVTTTTISTTTSTTTITPAWTVTTTTISTTTTTLAWTVTTTSCASATTTTTSATWSPVVHPHLIRLLLL